MKNLSELKQKIEAVRLELDEAFLQGRKDDIYPKSMKLDKLIEEYYSQKSKLNKL